MPKFIKSNTINEVSPKGIETTRQVLFTSDEVVSRVILNPSLLIEVTESHAAQVLRPQGRYQEVDQPTLDLLKEEIETREEVKAARAAKDKASKKAKPPVTNETKGGTLKFTPADE